jgi:hypothetical protein
MGKTGWGTGKPVPHSFLFRHPTTAYNIYVLSRLYNNLKNVRQLYQTIG